MRIKAIDTSPHLLTDGNWSVLERFGWLWIALDSCGLVICGLGASPRE